MADQRKGAYAVITGASQGLGRAFAVACAARGWNLFLASLPGTGLAKLAEDLASRGSTVIAIECDLASREGQSLLLRKIRDSGCRVGLLVNNVGTGQNGLFDLLPYESQRNSIDLNIHSTLATTYGLIPLLARNPDSRILTVSSLAAFYPMPMFAVYASTKAFLLNWSMALRHELADQGIGVTVLAPGGMYTSEEIRRKVRSQGLAGLLSTMEPEKVADFALDAARANRPLAIPGAFNRFLWMAGSLAPKNLVASSILSRWKKTLSRVCVDSARERCEGIPALAMEGGSPADDESRSYFRKDSRRESA